MAAMVNTAPIAMAKRFGGPGVGRGAADSRGRIAWTASRANGLNLGP